jgi:outer membrane protein OmpA-like peptidoglycan-associated protein
MTLIMTSSLDPIAAVGRAPRTVSRSTMAASVLCGALLIATPLLAQTSPTPAPAAPATPPAAAPQPPVPVPYAEALTKAATNLLNQVKVPSDPTKKVMVVIDPLIDGSTGNQSVSTVAMGRRIAELAKADFKHIDIQPFTPENVAKSPVVLVGTFTPINNATNKTEGERDAYRICLALADLSEKKVVAKAAIRAKTDGIDITPVAFFQDSPVWSKDAATDAYIRTCQASKLNEAIDVAYTDKIVAAAHTSVAIDAYNARRYAEALTAYQTALKAPGGEQLRVYNGIYLANWKLNRRAEAAEAFGKVVDHSLASNRLAVRFLFRPGNANFVTEPTVSAAYPMWLKKIAERTETKNSCLELVGHASPTGQEPKNVTLSAARAKLVRDRIAANSKVMSTRLTSSGVGSKETLIGTGKDNASDALDRRVEFKVVTTCT